MSHRKIVKLTFADGRIDYSSLAEMLQSENVFMTVFCVTLVLTVPASCALLTYMQRVPRTLFITLSACLFWFHGCSV